MLRVNGRVIPDVRLWVMCHSAAMSFYLLAHRHTPKECPVVFASWTGFPSPLRRQTAWGSCLSGGHHLWWTVEANDASAALAFLPAYVANRTEAIPVRPVTIP
jgi:hypothetical protein